MFYVSYIFAELRRRAGRTLLTALGLGVGVGLVVAVTALSDGLDRAQDKVLEPLTGVGTDMSVTRPINVGDDTEGGGGPLAGLSQREREQLEDETGRGRLDLQDVGDPGEKFSETSFMSTQLSFPESTVEEMRRLDGVQDTAASLTLNAITISGTVPEEGFQGRGGGGFGPGGGGAPGGGGDQGGGRQNIDFENMTVTGIDVSKSNLATVGPAEITEGEYLHDDGKREAVVNVSYAQTNDIAVGDEVELKGKKYEVVGIAQAPLGGATADMYLKLDQLQKISDRKGRVNTAQIRAAGTDVVPAVEKRVEATLEGASVTTSADLAERVGGSLTDAKELSDKLGIALTIVALVAAFLIASLLTLSSVAKRIRELGTLKALGWPQRKVVRQVTGESIAQGALGGILGGLIGIAAAAAINAVGITLQASVAAPTGGGPGLGGMGGPPGGGGFGQGAVQAGSTSVALDAPVDFGLIVVAISLALLGGLIAGSAGGLRAARLRPADALRHIG